MEMKCAGCGKTLTEKDLVGQWVRCDCGSQYLVDVEDMMQQRDEWREYVFPFDCDMKTFQTYCFDLLMRQSPADVISSMKQRQEKMGFLPTLTTIGGDGNYTVKYVGREKLNSNLSSLFAQNFSNDDKRFGREQRVKRNQNHKSLVETNMEYVEQLVKSGQITTNEIHYYPYFCLEYEYNGHVFSFASLGDVTDVRYDILPKEPSLDKQLRFIESGVTFKPASYAAIATLVIAVLCVVLYLWNICNISGISGWWWVVIVIVAPCIFMILATIGYLVLPSVHLVIANVYSFLGQIVVRMINLVRLRAYLNVVKPIQMRKKKEAKAMYNIRLNDLHIRYTIPPFKLFSKQ